MFSSKLFAIQFLPQPIQKVILANPANLALRKAGIATNATNQKFMRNWEWMTRISQCQGCCAPPHRRCPSWPSERMLEYHTIAQCTQFEKRPGTQFTFVYMLNFCTLSPVKVSHPTIAIHCLPSLSSRSAQKLLVMGPTAPWAAKVAMRQGTSVGVRLINNLLDSQPSYCSHSATSWGSTCP